MNKDFWSLPKHKFKSLKNADAIIFLGLSYLFWWSWERLYIYTPLAIYSHRTSIVAIVYFGFGFYYKRLRDKLEGL